MTPSDLSETPTSELINELEARSLCCCIAMIMDSETPSDADLRISSTGSRITLRGLVSTALDQIVDRINEGLEDDVDGED